MGKITYVPSLGNHLEHPDLWLAPCVDPARAKSRDMPAAHGFATGPAGVDTLQISRRRSDLDNHHCYRRIYKVKNQSVMFHSYLSILEI
jgi:hypothetical protein